MKISKMLAAVALACTAALFVSPSAFAVGLILAEPAPAYDGIAYMPGADLATLDVASPAVDAFLDLGPVAAATSIETACEPQADAPLLFASPEGDGGVHAAPGVINTCRLYDDPGWFVA